MYLSHPVRRIRDDPDPDESVGLVVDPADGATEAVVDAVRALDGRVEKRLQFGSLWVVLPEVAVASLTERDDVGRIETTNTLGLGLGE